MVFSISNLLFCLVEKSSFSVAGSVLACRFPSVQGSRWTVRALGLHKQVKYTQNILDREAVCDKLAQKKIRKLITLSGYVSVSGTVFFCSGNTHKACDVEQ